MMGLGVSVPAEVCCCAMTFNRVCLWEMQVPVRVWCRHNPSARVQRPQQPAQFYSALYMYIECCHKFSID